MNFPAHGLHSTCPHGTVIVALSVLLSVLSHAGQIGVCASADVDVDVEVALVENVSVMRVFRDRGWVSVGEEAGQRGCSFWGLDVEGRWEVEGVREGTQKEGRVGFAACGG